MPAPTIVREAKTRVKGNREPWNWPAAIRMKKVRKYAAINHAIDQSFKKSFKEKAIKTLLDTLSTTSSTKKKKVFRPF